MAILTRGATWLAAASLLTLPSTPVVYSPLAREAYLADSELGFIRPGLKLKLNSVTIPADRRPVVDISFTDDGNNPIDRLGNAVPGPVSLSFILAWWDPDKRQYTAYTTRTQTSPITGVAAVQAGTDAGGTFTDVALGRATYRFTTTLPATFDQTKTHTLGIYSTRNLVEFLEKSYYANIEYDFRPDGVAVTAKWAGMTDAQSCLKCHDPLALHGGSRRDVKLCVLCHNPQTIDPDTGNTMDMKVMIHKIHRGENLPSVEAGTPYQIIGNQQSLHDYSTVVHPQDIRNCTTCHDTTAPDAAAWYTRPTRATCGSCHDDINWTTGAHHAAGAQLDDTKCASCHAPQGEREYDASVKGAHTVPEKSKQLKGLKMEITAVDQASPGKKPIVTFKVTNGDGSVVDPKTLATCAILMVGPTADYKADPFREDARQAVFNGTTATYTFNNAIPAEATGTYAFSADVYRNVTLNPGTAKEATLRECALNPIKYVAVTGGAAVARRSVVSQAKCNTCHDRLALHGGQRLVIEECVMCHNPQASDKSRRPAAEGPVESIDMKRMIHRIHTGEGMTQEYTVFGFATLPATNPVNFNEVRYPGDRRNCLACHTNAASYNLPTGGSMSTQTLRDYFTPQGPGTASCLGCHDSRDAAAHASLNTAVFGEACATCHGANSDWSASKVHAR